MHQITLVTRIPYIRTLSCNPEDAAQLTLILHVRCNTPYMQWIRWLHPCKKLRFFVVRGTLVILFQTIPITYYIISPFIGGRQYSRSSELIGHFSHPICIFHVHFLSAENFHLVISNIMKNCFISYLSSEKLMVRPSRSKDLKSSTNKTLYFFTKTSFSVPFRVGSQWQVKMYLSPIKKLSKVFFTMMDWG